MKKLAAGILIFVLIAAIAGHFLYPVISDQLGRRRDAGILRDYRAKTAQMTQEQRDKLFAEAKAWNESLQEIRAEDVFTAGNTRTTRDYQNRMNVHEGVIAELVIPDIKASLPVYHLSTETPATRKLVHMDSSSLPADGSGENIVLAGPGILRAEGFPGELGLTDDRMLEDLDKLIPGNLVILNVLDRTMVYRVKGVQMLASNGLGELDLTPGEGEEKLTLVPRQIIKDIARVREFGSEKYKDPESWKRVEIGRYRDAAFRHWLRYLDDPHGMDDESGLKGGCCVTK